LEVTNSFEMKKGMQSKILEGPFVNGFAQENNIDKL